LAQPRYLSQSLCLVHYRLREVVPRRGETKPLVDENHDFVQHFHGLRHTPHTDDDVVASTHVAPVMIPSDRRAPSFKRASG